MVMNAGERYTHLLLPEPVSGYAFDPDSSWWSVIMPESSRNLIVNPSFEAWTVTEYSTDGWIPADYVEFDSVAASAGRRCAKLTMGSGDSYIEYDEGIAVVAGPYTFSLDVHIGQVGVSLQLQVRDTSTIVARRIFTFDREGWHRIHLTYQEATTGTRQLRLLSPTTNDSGVVFYTDAWQFEAKDHPTTYFDGDMIGLTDTRPNQSYYWLGIPHRSESVRRETASNGGRIYNWSSNIGFLTTSIIGLEMAPVESIVEVLADGAEIHEGSRSVARPFTITGKIYAEKFINLATKQKTLRELLRPNRTVDGAQMILRYQYLGSAEEEVGMALDIACAYDSGLEGQINNLYQAVLSLQFRASRPSLAAIYDNSAELLLYKTLTGNNIIFKDENGDYINLGVGATDAFPTRVGFLRNGMPAAFGPFASLAGDAVDDSAYWDGDSWVQLGDLAGRNASAVIDGYLTGYPLTISTTTGDVSEYDEDTDTWTDLSTGFLGTIHAISRDPEGNIWVAGEFETDAGAIVTYNNVAKWNVTTEAWEVLGDGLTDPGTLNPTLEVFTVLADDDGYVYFGGWFEQGDSGATTTLANGAIRWNPATSEWDAMGLGFNAAPNQFIRGHDGYIYAVGEFDQDGTETYDLRGFARWNGYAWEEVFELVRFDGTFGADGVRIDEDGVFWFFAYTTTAPDDLFVAPTLGLVGTFGYKDGVFYPSIGSVSITHMSIGPGNRTIYAVRSIDGEDDYVVPALNTIEYEGDADAPVALHIAGQCVPVQCVNLDTKGGAYFRSDFILGLEEEVVVRSDTQRALAYSHARKNLTKFVSAGASSFRALRLRPGTNRFSVFARNILSVDTMAWLVWKDRYNGIV